jgi:hypothetical protein
MGLKGTYQTYTALSTQSDAELVAIKLDRRALVSYAIAKYVFRGLGFFLKFTRDRTFSRANFIGDIRYKLTHRWAVDLIFLVFWIGKHQGAHHAWGHDPLAP